MWIDFMQFASIVLACTAAGIIGGAAIGHYQAYSKMDIEIERKNREQR